MTDARGAESSAINALFEVALQIAGQQRSLFTCVDRAASHLGSSHISATVLRSRVGEGVPTRPNGAPQPGARSSLHRAPQLTRDDGGKSIRTTQASDVRVAQVS